MRRISGDGSVTLDARDLPMHRGMEPIGIKEPCSLGVRPQGQTGYDEKENDRQASKLTTIRNVWLMYHKYFRIFRDPGDLNAAELRD